MRITILDDALDDLADGYRFYERQEPGIGNYFLASLYSDIEALRLYAGIHPLCTAFTGIFRSDSLSPSITMSRMIPSGSLRCWMVGKIQPLSGNVSATAIDVPAK